MREEVFFLAYAGLRWDPDAVLAMPTAQRRWFVERLERQKAFEQEELDKDKT